MTITFLRCQICGEWSTGNHTDEHRLCYRCDGLRYWRLVYKRGLVGGPQDHGLRWLDGVRSGERRLTV